MMPCSRSLPACRRRPRVRLYSVVRPALFRAKFLAARANAPRCPPGFFLSIGSKLHRYSPDAPAPDTMFVHGPRSLLGSRHNVVHPGPFRAFLTNLKRRRAYVAVSCGRLLLCAPRTGARYWIVDPAADQWVPLPPPPPLASDEDTSYRESPAFHCTAARILTVAYLTTCVLDILH